MRYRSKPSEVEAVQWRGDNREEVEAVGGVLVFILGNLRIKAGPGGKSGWVHLPEGDWILRSLEDPSDVWPMDDTAFRNKYEPINDEPMQGGAKGD